MLKKFGNSFQKEKNLISMCGIVAAFSYHSTADKINSEEIIRIRDSMNSRGPDGKGFWASDDKSTILAHRRLSIIDLSNAGSQPMGTVDSKIHIVFNGEIYNYKDLRSELIQKGHRFISNTDTEVLLHLYEEKGLEMVHDLRGMYAFAIWDDRNKGLFLARDPFGIKPLYYSDNGKCIKAASQVKALIAGKGIDTTPEPAGHVGFFLWGHVPEPYTLYKSIRSIPAGTYLWLDKHGTRKTESFYSLKEVFNSASINEDQTSPNDKRKILRNSLKDSIRHHMIADIPVGIFLSSGLDSATITALASETDHEQIHTVTLGFEEYKGTHNDEVPLAEEISKKYGTKHSTVWISKEDFQNHFNNLIDAMDQPTIDGINTYFVSLAANKSGLKAAISGIGGDELFGGYPSFSQIPQMVKTFSPFKNIPALGKTFRTISSPLFNHFTSPKYAGLFEYGGTYGGAYLLRRGMFMPWELPALFDKDFLIEGWKELQPLIRLNETIDGLTSGHLKVSALEIKWYMRNQLLRDTDWAGMAHSIEIRVPFLDINLIKSITPLLNEQTGTGKKEMAQSPSVPLPTSVLNRKKTGFSIPVREWIGTDRGFESERGLRGWAQKIYHKQLIIS